MPSSPPVKSTVVLKVWKLNVKDSENHRQTLTNLLMLYIVSIPLLVGFVSSRHLKKNLLLISQSTMYNTSYSVKCIQKWIPYSKLWTAPTAPYYVLHQCKNHRRLPSFLIASNAHCCQAVQCTGNTAGTIQLVLHVRFVQGGHHKGWCNFVLDDVDLNY